MGFAGVQNFPTVALIDGLFRQGLEETGMSYQLEVEMVRVARELDMLTAVYCLTADETRLMAEAGADVIVAHLGLTVKGTVGARTVMTLDDAVERTQAIRDMAAEVNPEVIVLCHGGPIAEPADARYVLERTTGVAGFFGASSMERLPSEAAITDRVREFKGIRTGG
jgi:predicted TIM-barrel enzyme